MKVPIGFSFAGLNAGIKPNRPDVALFVSNAPCAAAGCFTINKARAAPVLDAEARLPAEGVRAIVVNSGNANALTGPEGLADVRAVHAAIAEALHVPTSSVYSASTGVIGLRLPAHKIVAAAPELARALGADPLRAAEAILTTDTRVKMASRALVIDGKEITLAGICKGAGMVAPQLATVVAVIVTDCDLSADALAMALRRATGKSFNNLTVDNDMSTNDAVFALANGRAGNTRITGPGEALSRFSEALEDLCVEMAREIAADGEGATKLLEVTVQGAPSEEIARDLARSIAGSSLVKAAMFGADPNWGRILATVGARAGSQGYPVDPSRAAVRIQGVELYREGPVPYQASAVRGRLREPEVRIEVALSAGEASATAWGCDLSYDFVKISADYSSLIVTTPSGGVAKDDRLANYSPSFKVSLLVEALSYISRFAGTRCVIQCGGAAMVKESLKKAFCDDINLLRSVGLKPIVVHGGGPEITRTLEKLGRRADFADDVRVTDASDLKVVEMVLTGSVNKDLVTLLNREGGHAVGVSGKDGALLRARKLLGEDGRDLGQVAEISSVNRGFLEMLLAQEYVPVVSPIGIGEDGQSYNLVADVVASEIAIAIAASKLIYLTDAPGVLEGDELVSELTAPTLRQRLEAGTIKNGTIIKARSILKALAAGVERVHVIDGRTPHSVIAELFTDRGVGTLITQG
ncbi:MAG TPA: bifunctional glutamate N-acetyltransferase/amino-acid acetyltransferase ArgJ [Myxococcaceae bacterium]|nr:bifunctional glutamate N-acetyltransferase/amino-acid acetyltransferase ArgJ [Myxococcaceae bacterium]